MPTFAFFKKNKPLPVLRTSFGFNPNPDPALIRNSHEWLHLLHTSHSLVEYDHQKGHFTPFLAESWEIQDESTYVFKLKADLKFHDNSPITTKDVLASLKRILIKKTSTHFPIWKYVVGCEGLKTLEDSCEGLKVLDERTLIIKLKEKNKSFFLQMASPETGIWSHKDIDPVTLDIKARSFSGPYYVSERRKETLVLKPNPHSPVIKAFPSAPRKILNSLLSQKKIEQGLLQNELDIFHASYSAYKIKAFLKKELKVFNSIPATILYLHGLKDHSFIGKDLIQSFWKEAQKEDILTAENFLPFQPENSLDKKTFLENLPDKSQSPIKILLPPDYFHPQLLEALKKAASNVNVHIEFLNVSGSEYTKAFQERIYEEKADFALIPYIASERYVATELRYMTGRLKAPLDLSSAETPDSHKEKSKVLKTYQRWLLKNQWVVPIYFFPSQILYQKNLSVGEQPKVNVSMELWRVKGR